MSSLIYLSSLLKALGRHHRTSAEIMMTSQVISSFSKKNNLGASGTLFVTNYLKLIDRAVDEVNSIKIEGGKKQKMKSKIAQARKLVPLIYQESSWAGVVEKFEFSTLPDFFEFMDDTLSSAGVMEVFDKKKSDEYSQKIQIILNSIEKTDLDLTIKNAVSEQLKALLKIFKTLEYLGPQEAELHLKSILGEMHIYAEELTNSSEDAKAALSPLMEFIGDHYPKFKWSLDAGLTVANGAFLAIQTGAV